MTDGMKKSPTIGVFGHSHIICLLDALGDWRPPVDDGVTDFWAEGDYLKHRFDLSVSDNETGQSYGVIGFPIANKTEGRWLVEPSQQNPKRVTVSKTFQEYMQRFAECDVLISTVFGNEFASFQFLQHSVPYDFAELGKPADNATLKPGTMPIDRNDVRAAIDVFVRQIVLVLKAIRNLYPKKKIMHMSPPPPIEDPTVAKFQEGFEEAFKTRGITDSALRQKWYRSYCYLLRGRLKEAGFRTILPPGDAITEDGFIQPEFLEGLTHGNADYGRLSWQAILRELRP